MLVKETIPDAVNDLVTPRLDGEEARVAVCSDLDLAGCYSEHWMLASDKRLLVLDRNNGDAQVTHDYPLSDVKELACEGQIGNGFVTALVDGKRMRLLRYSGGQGRKFGAAVKQIDALAKSEEPKPDPEALPSRCPRCGFLMEPGSKVCVNCVKKGQVLVRLLQYARPHVAKGLITLVLMLLVTVLGLVGPYLYKVLMDDVLPHGNKQLLGIVVLGFFGASALSTVFTIIQARIGAWMGARITHSIRMSLCEHLERLSVAYFDKRQTGALMARVNQDTAELQGFLTGDIYWMVGQIFRLVGALVMIVKLDWKLGLIALIPAPITTLMMHKVPDVVWKSFRRLWHRRGKFGAILNDSLSGVRMVKAFAQEDREAARLTKASGELAAAGAQAESMFATYFPSMFFVMTSGTFLIWWFGGLQVIGNQIKVGTLMAMLGYVGMLNGPLSIITRMGDWFGRVLAAAERVFEVLDTQPEQPDIDKATPMPSIKGHVELKNVTFGYDPHVPVLHEINLDVQPGEMIGLVGHSGAGKSTTINLICRFYAAQEGELLIDGVNIKDIRLDDLRRQIGIVPQEPYLFVGTIAENIAYAKPDATIEDIIRASKAANAHDFIVNFPDGYETQIGERGQGLSGGEKQRIAIARAVLHDPKILILDEATSSVDTGTEKQIQDALARLVQNRTTFAIAHRLSTLRHAQRLMVLEHGKIAEIGTHDELMEKKGTFFKLVEMQTELSRIKAVDG